MQFLATIVEGSHHSIYGAYTIPPFRFQPRNRSMDWRRMSVLDVGRVTRELDVAILQENLTDITFCTLDQEVCSHCSQPLDQALLNVLRLAQFTIEYLLHSQDFLTTRVAQLEVHLQASLSQQSRCQQELDCQAEEVRHLREEKHRQRKMIKDLQQLLQRSGGQSYYMCHLCEKTFLSASYLWSHFQRRHEGTAQGGKQKQEESMEAVVRDLRAQLIQTQEEQAALLKKQRQLQEANTTCERERDAKTIFEEWKAELSEEIEQQKRVFLDELKNSVLPNSPLEEKPAAPQSHSVMCSNLGSLQDAECGEQLRQTQEPEALRILKETKTQERELKRTFHELEKELAANNTEEANTNCERERDAKTIFKEWKAELSEEIDQQKKVFWDELISSVLPNSPLEEKPAAPQSHSVMCSNLGSLQDAECGEQLRQTLELEALRILKETKTQVQDENQELQRENKMLRRENNKLQKKKEKIQKENEKLQEESKKPQENEKLQREYEKLQKENQKLLKVNEKLQKKSEKLQKEKERLQEESEKPQENEKLQREYEKLQKENRKLQKESKKLQKENERLHDMLCQLHVTASQSQQHILSLSTQMQKQAKLITSQEMTQTSSLRKVKGSCKGPKAVNMDKDSSKEESEDSQDEPQKVREAQGQNISLLKLFGQTQGNDLQERQESTGRKREAKEVPTRTSRHFMWEREEKKRGKFSEWCSRASERAARWFSGPRRRARQRW